MNILRYAQRPVRSAIATIVVVTGAMALTVAAHADEYPIKPVKLMVGFSAGGGVDTYGRTMASFIHEYLGQPMIVINKTGAASMIAAKATVDQASDGYTLYLTNAGTLLAKSLMDGKKSKVDPIMDLEPLGGLGQLVTGLFVPHNSKFRTAADLVTYAKANPGKLRWSHPGRGALHMIAGAAFLKANNIVAKDIPFKGGSKARNAVAGEQVDFAFLGIQLGRGFESKIRPLGVTAAKRDSTNKNVPTFAEQGLASMDITGPIVVFGRPNLPTKVKQKISDAIKSVAADKGFKKLLKKAGLSAFYFDANSGKARMEKLKTDLLPVVANIKINRKLK